MASNKTLDLPLGLDYPPAEARLTEDLPEGEGWIYEPKWDGFRCLAFRAGDEIRLQSKSSKPLGRYFPDVVADLLELDADRFVLDGEIVIPAGKGLSFDDLLLRIHPAESRVQKLAAETPALFVVFDLLVDASGKDLTGLPFEQRRLALEEFAAAKLPAGGPIRLSPSTRDADAASRWLAQNRTGLDGVIAKRTELAYASGTRDGMKKVKTMRTADCVVGGFRWSKDGKSVASLLLGLYNGEGKLDHIGFCSSFDRKTRAEVTRKVKPVIGGSGFSGSGPQGASRWRSEEAAEWIAVDPTLVVEVRYDHFSGGRFRHGTKFLRWRPDKDPSQCTRDQIETGGSSAMKLIG